ncbi:hypothetical protein [Acetivibrio straminisolvens]|nr:hypothetical protein [Acetivibrio straminisolvens]
MVLTTPSEDIQKLVLNEVMRNWYEKEIIFDVMGVIFEVGDDPNDLLVP